MIWVVGLLFLLLGAALLHVGGQAQNVVPANASLAPDVVSSSIGYLAAAATAPVGGLCAMPRRTA